MKKLISLTLVSALTLSLAACGASDSNGTAASASAEAPAVTEAPVATEAPAATEAPVATEAPKATETPAVTEAPDAADSTKENAAKEAEVTEETETASEEKGTEDTSDIDYTTGTPWLDCDLDGNVTEDTEASLKDHFALAVNKEKILALEIPEGYSSAGSDTDNEIKNNEDNKNMYLGDAPEEHDTKLAYDLFWLMMDWDSRNQQGVEPLKEITDAIDGLGSIDEVKSYCLDTPEEQSLAKLWTVYTQGDLTDTSRMSIMFDGCKLFLEDSAEYTSLTDAGKTKKKAVTELAQKMLKKQGYSDDETRQKIDNCFAFETEASAFIPSQEVQHSPDYASSIAENYFSYDEFKEMEGGAPVVEKMDKDGYPKAERYLIENVNYLKGLDGLLSEDNLSLIKDYLIVHSAIEAAGSLDRECYEWKVEYDNTISGATGMLPDEEVFASEVNKKLKWPVAKLYSDTYLKAEDKERLTGITDTIMEAYRGMIQDAEFLSDETKTKAFEKLDAMGKCILYPDDWSLYSCEDLNFASKEDGGKLWEALAAIRAYDLKTKAKESGEPVNKAKWKESPNTINCSYNAQSNTMYIFGAFCNGVMYNSEMTDDEIYGGVGFVIGHEISHAFDQQGSQYDKDGNLVNWWTDEDAAVFKEKNEKLAAYYNNIHPWEGQDFTGEIMTGEACADMASCKTILRIAAEMDDFDYDRWFRSIAAVHLQKETLQEALGWFTNVHPMHYLRVNCTLQQFDKFLDFYDIKEGDGMYLAPEDRVAIW